MNEKLGDYHEDDEIVPARTEQAPRLREQQKTMTEFLESLRTELARIRQVQADDARSRLEDIRDRRNKEIPKMPSTEEIKEIQRKREKKQAQEVWGRIITEGIDRQTLKEFLDNVEVFSLADLKWLCATIDDLIREWDPSFHSFLRDVKAQLKGYLQFKEEDRKDE